MIHTVEQIHHYLLVFARHDPSRKEANHQAQNHHAATNDYITWPWPELQPDGLTVSCFHAQLVPIVLKTHTQQIAKPSAE